MTETKVAESKTVWEELHEIDRLISANNGVKPPTVEAPAAPLEETESVAETPSDLREDIAVLRDAKLRHSETGHVKKWAMYAQNGLIETIGTLREAAQEIGPGQTAEAIRRIVEHLERVEDALEPERA